MAEDTKKENIKKKKLGKRVTLAVILSILIGVILALVVLIATADASLKRYSEDMVIGINYGRSEYNNNVSKNEIYNESNAMAAQDIAAFTAHIYEDLGYSSEVRDEIATDISSYFYFYFFRGYIDSQTNSVIGYMNRDNDNSSFDTATEEELFTLFSKGEYTTATGTHIYASPVGKEGYAVLTCDFADVLKNQSVLSAYSNKREERLLRIDTETGIIDDASDINIIGATCDSVVKLDTLKSMTPWTGERIYLADGSRVYAFVDEGTDNQLFCSYIKLTSVLPEIIRNSILPILLAWIFIAQVLLYVIKFSNGETSEDKKNKVYSKLFKNFYVDRRLMSHLSGLLTFGSLLILIAMMYFQTLVNFSEHNIKADNDLHTLEALYNLGEENQSLITTDYRDVRGILIDYISGYYSRHPEMLTEDDILNACSKLPNTLSIAFISKDGVIELDTEGNIGYELSKSADSLEYECQDVLSGKCDIAAYNRIDGDTYTYIVKRNREKKGLVRILCDRTLIDDFSDYTGITPVLLAASLGNSDKAYTDESNLDTLNWIDTTQNVIVQKNNSIGDDLLKSVFAGVAKIDGSNYYVNSRNSESCPYVIITATRLRDLIGFNRNWVAFLCIILIFSFEELLLLLASYRKFESAPDNIKTSVIGRKDIDEQMMDDRFKRNVTNMFFTTCVVVAGLLIFDSLYGKTSLLSYLLKSNWEKGFNLFSMTMILISMAVALIAGYILRKLIIFFTKNMGPRGVTIGRMMGSLVRFAILFIVILNIMVDLGVDSEKVVAGVGVAGLAFSLCAQSTLNDLISGFFIVFEGLFNIGDWITVDDFRGEVLEIGIRTTKVGVGGNVQIINNSSLKNVLVMARNGMGAVCIIDIAYKEDADKVIKLIEDNAPDYREKIPYIVEGPFVDGVVALGDSGVSLRVWAIADQEKVIAVEREIRRVTKSLFDENNIEIPFNQVTIHTASDEK